MPVRLLKIAGADLNVFDFDYDLTWMGFFVSADGKVYGRYGGRDASGPDARLSLPGLRHALQAALAAHRSGKKLPAPPDSPPQEGALQASAAREQAKNSCIHCHQVNEFRRAQRQAAGVWKREEVWVYPLPENVGLVLEVDRGDHVRSVVPGSAAAKIGVRAGDVVRSVHGVPVASQADFRYGLHRAPWKGKVALVWSRSGKEMSGQLELAEAWKKTNVTWRPSMLDILPSLTVYGDDLTAAEKKALGLLPGRLAFRQDQTVHVLAKTAGVRAGDVIIGVDGKDLEMTMKEFLAHVRRNYLAGDKITLEVMRDGKRLSLPMTLK